MDKEISVTLNFDVRPAIGLNECTVIAVVDYADGKSEGAIDESKKLSSLLREEVEGFSESSINATRDEYRLQEWRECSKLIKNIISLIEALPDEGEK